MVCAYALRVDARRTGDRYPPRDRDAPKQTAEERLKEKDEMKKRRDFERQRMEVARDMRRNIDSAIREKMAAGRELAEHER